ncbi:CAP domain-containing protein [Nocardiopsis gilva]|uniref:CAP domain-containing protein n=1 Tax=Nocardiopsis gilva TaxID=280236 RepID=UPI00036C9352|nr:CAP domain-containing protein [Nocardiopsis gilva]
MPRNRDESPGARQRPRPSTRSSTARDRWKRPLIGALVAVPVGLGVAAGLVLVSVPQGHGPAQAGSDAGSAFPDDRLPPAVSDDDFFDDDTDSGKDDTKGTDSAPSASGDSGQREAAATAEGKVEASESPKDDSDGSGSSKGGDSTGSAGSSSGSDSAGGSDGAGGSSASDAPSSSSPSGGSSAQTSQVVTLVNSERASAGCGPLRVDDRLTTASQKHSEDMAARDYMAHETPEGKSPQQRAQEAGYTAWSGENVAAGYSSAEDVMDGWMNSEGHRANILNCDFKAIGVGEADGRWTQNFGRE